MGNRQHIAVDGVRVGDSVQYREVTGAIVESAVTGLLRGTDARLIGFYPVRANAVEPKVAVTLDRIVKAWRPRAHRG